MTILFPGPTLHFINVTNRSRTLKKQTVLGHRNVSELPLGQTDCHLKDGDVFMPWNTYVTTWKHTYCCWADKT